MKPATRHERSFGLALLMSGAIAIFALTLTPQPPAEHPAPHLCVICGDRGAADAILNILLFAPLGAGLALIGGRTSRTATFALILSACVELAQLTLVPGREANTGDIIMNTLGAAAAAFVARRWRTWLFPNQHIGALLGVGGGIAWLLMLAVAATAMKPLPSGEQPFVQIKPDIPTEAQRFPGAIPGAFLDGLKLTDGPLPDSIRQASALARGTARLEALVHPVLPPPAWSAILVRIVDRSQHTELQLTQLGDALLFEPHLRASALRLDPPILRVDRVFPTPDQRNCDTAYTVRIFGQLSEGHLVAGASGAQCRLELRAPLRATYGWMLLLPFEYTLGPEASWFTAVWIVVCVLVWSYWIGAWTARPVRGAAIGLSVLVVGLGVIPAIFVIPRSAASEWIAGVLGLVGGMAIGRAVPRDD